jgi:hypothetical protein
MGSSMNFSNRVSLCHALSPTEVVTLGLTKEDKSVELHKYTGRRNFGIISLQDWVRKARTCGKQFRVMGAVYNFVLCILIDVGLRFSQRWL